MMATLRWSRRRQHQLRGEDARHFKITIAMTPGAIRERATNPYTLPYPKEQAIHAPPVDETLRTDVTN